MNIHNITLDKTEHCITVKINDNLPTIYLIKNEVESWTGKNPIIFNDISYFIGFYSNSVYILTLNPYMTEFQNNKAHGTYKEYSFNFSGYELLSLIQSYNSFGDSLPYTMPLKELNEISNSSKPCSTLSCNEDIKAIIRESSKNDSIDNLFSCFKAIFRIAKNNSSLENPVKIFISYDSYQDENKCHPDFYYQINDCTGQRIYNGGIIYHGFDNKYHTHS